MGLTLVGANATARATYPRQHLQPRRSESKQFHLALSSPQYPLWQDRLCAPHRGEPALPRNAVCHLPQHTTWPTDNKSRAHTPQLKIVDTNDFPSPADSSESSKAHFPLALICVANDDDCRVAQQGCVWLLWAYFYFVLLTSPSLCDTSPDTGEEWLWGLQRVYQTF